MIRGETLGEMSPKRMKREHRPILADTGCSITRYDNTYIVSPSCFTCPLEICRHDGARGARVVNEWLMREHNIGPVIRRRSVAVPRAIEMMQRGYSVHQIAMSMGLSDTTIEEYLRA